MEPWALNEFASAVLPDKRMLQSLVAMTERIADNAEVSFSQAAGHDGRQAARRLFGHQEVEPDGILAGHYQQTGTRCSQHALVLVAQDTTIVDYTGHKHTTGLGPIGDDPIRQGMLVHSALAITPAGLPLGLLHTSMWARDPDEFGKRARRKALKIEQKESSKWIDGLASIERHVPPEVEVLVIQDREADVFAFFFGPRRPNVNLLIRAYQPRRVQLPEWVEQPADCPQTLIALMDHAPVLGQVDVMVPRQPGQEARQVTLTVRATPIKVLPPKASVIADGYAPLTVHVVNAYEESQEPGEKGIHWVLICTRPLASLSDCLDMVRYYSMRWAIERLHYVLKSGYRIERLQIDDASRLRNAMAVYYVVAWHVLYLTHLARIQPEAPATHVMTEHELMVLAAVTKRTVATAADTVTAIAILGGMEYYRNAPPPGPKRLWMGIRKLMAMVQAWDMALSVLTGEM